jgi:hypothetical protein
MLIIEVRWISNSSGRVTNPYLADVGADLQKHLDLNGIGYSPH